MGWKILLPQELKKDARDLLESHGHTLIDGRGFETEDVIEMCIRDRVLGWLLLIIWLNYWAVPYRLKANWVKELPVRSVSYTHLDVYKRQMQNRSKD